MKFLTTIAVLATVAFCASSTVATDDDKKKNAVVEQEKEKQELSHKHLEELKKEVHSPKANAHIEEIHKKASRPLMIQEIIRVREKIVVDEKNKPKEFAADIVKAIYKIENGTRKRLAFSRFFIRPRAIPSQQQHKAAGIVDHHLPLHSREDVDFLGLLGVLGFVIGFGAIAYLIASYLDRRDQKKKEIADYAKLLKVPTSEQMANNAPMAPSSRA